MMAVVHDLAEAQGTIASQATTYTSPAYFRSLVPLNSPSRRHRSPRRHPKGRKAQARSRQSFPGPSSARTLTIRARSKLRRLCKTLCTRCCTIVPPR